MALPAEDDVVFRSDVSLVRVDVQVLDRSNRAITSLNKEDFVLRENGQEREIRDFARENMPIDILFLVDVSTSMRPHVERIGAAAQQAQSVLGKDDRVAMMVFDRQVRVRSGFRSGPSVAAMEFRRLLDEEFFNGGTDITRGLMEASRYMGRNGRRDARRAIVIITDDQTERDRDEQRVLAALEDADTVLSLVQTPDAMGHRSRFPGGGAGGGGGIGNGGWADIILGGPMGWPGGGGGRYPRGGGRFPRTGGGGGTVGGTQSAGTAEIARRSGGDAMSDDHADALETTLSRLRQRYALFFYLPQGARAGQSRNVVVELASQAARRYPGAELRYRRSYEATSDVISSTPAESTTAPGPAEQTPTTPSTDEPPRIKRRPAVNERSGSGPGTVMTGGDSSASSASKPAAAGEPATAAEAPKTQGGGWRRVKPGEVP